MKFPIKDFFSKCDQNPKTIFKKKKNSNCLCKKSRTCHAPIPLKFSKKKFFGPIWEVYLPQKSQKEL